MTQHFIRTDARLLYYSTQLKYTHDDDVDKEDLDTLCNILYQHELLHLFYLDHDDDITLLTNKVHDFYLHVKHLDSVKRLIQTHFFIDDFATFNTFFSYDLLHSLYHTLSTLQIETTTHSHIHTQTHSLPIP
jgi:hypothetical protein